MKKGTKAVQAPPTKPIVTQTGAIPPSVGFSITCNLLISWWLLALVASCTPADDEAPAAPTLKNVVMLEVDYSKSATLNYFDTSKGKRLFFTLAKYGKGEIKFLPVNANSAAHDILSISVSGCDTPSTEGITNIYRLAKAKAQNKRTYNGFKTQAQVNLAPFLSAIQKPHDAPFTDLAGALLLAKQTLEQEIYKTGCNRYLLLCSDALNDPKAHRHQKLEAVHMPDVMVVVVRPILSLERLKEIFPDSRVYLFTDANDAITFIDNQ